MKITTLKICVTDGALSVGEVDLHLPAARLELLQVHAPVAVRVRAHEHFPELRKKRGHAKNVGIERTGRPYW